MKNETSRDGSIEKAPGKPEIRIDRLGQPTSGVAKNVTKLLCQIFMPDDSTRSVYDVFVSTDSGKLFEGYNVSIMSLPCCGNLHGFVD